MFFWCTHFSEEQRRILWTIFARVTTAISCTPAELSIHQTFHLLDNKNKKKKSQDDFFMTNE